MKKSILLSLALVGMLSAECVRDNVNEVVTCSETKLMWQDNDDVLKEDWKTWEEAIKYCEDEIGVNGAYAGFDDWRLPNIRELKSITERTKKINPSIKDGFTKVSDDGYWSSTTSLSYTNYAWVVDFRGGYDNWYYKSGHYSVRCVR